VHGPGAEWMHDVRNLAGLIYSVVKAKGNTRVGVIRKRGNKIRTRLVPKTPVRKGNAHSGCDTSRIRRQALCE
jgi:hypothetical protein